jgi:hypothetical protein
MHHRRRLLWLACCVVCLFIPILKPDGGIIFVAPLILLTFPAGFVGDRAFDVLYEQMGRLGNCVYHLFKMELFRHLLANRRLLWLFSVVRFIAVDRQALGSSG